MKYIVNRLLFCLVVCSALYAEVDIVAKELEVVVKSDKNQLTDAVLDVAALALENEKDYLIQDSVLLSEEKQTDYLAHKRRDDADLERLIERLVEQLMNQKRDDGESKYLKKSHFFLGVVFVVGLLVAAGIIGKPYYDKQLEQFAKVDGAVNASELNGRALIARLQDLDARMLWVAGDLDRRDRIQGVQIGNIDNAIRAFQVELDALKGCRAVQQSSVAQPVLQLNEQKPSAVVVPSAQGGRLQPVIPVPLNRPPAV